LWTNATRLEAAAQRGSPARAAFSWLASTAEMEDRIAIESGMQPSQGIPQPWITIPFHSRAPEVYRGAYWIGWYAGCDWVVVREDRVVRFLRERERYPQFLRFYLDLKAQAKEERVFGDQSGQRVRVLRQERSATPLATGWRARVAAGPAAGLPGGFLANLGAFFARAGESAAAVELLEEARTAGYDDLGIHLNLAAALLEQGRELAAGRVLDEALQRHPDSPELLYNLGLTAVRAQLWERAARVLRRLRTIWPRSAETAYLLGIALGNLQRFDAARAELEAALALGLEGEDRAEAQSLLQQLERR
ncbi:MAG: tetratricopeptide repeat protein, partial [Candidatus Eisenbacteria bacterium]|nr:tetratricopeptide repeat protein [Candidatus Eisenbacteria bacterium]